MAKFNPKVQQARQMARQTARSSGASRPQIKQAGKQATQQARTYIKTARNLPQPPPQPSPGTETSAPGAAGQGGYFQYTPTQESQLNQPYQDLAAGGALGSLASVLGRQQGQGQMADLYGQGAATQLGGAAAGMSQLAPLGGQYTNTSGNLLSQYGGLMGSNNQIQQNLAGQIQGIQNGNLDVDPALVQYYQQQQRDLGSQMQRQLGPDWASSSAGIEAQGRFNQGRDTTLASQNYNRLLGLIGAQQGGMQNIGNQGQQFGQFGAGIQGQQFGQGQALGNMYGNMSGQLFDQSQALRGNQLNGGTQMLNNLSQIQNLYGNIPNQMANFGQAMAGQAGASVGAQGPYQQDRMTNAQLSFAPTSGQFAGQMMGQSGNRWINVGNSIGGMGGGG